MYSCNGVTRGSSPFKRYCDGMSAQEIHICVKGCVAYLGDFAHVMACPNCNEKRFTPCQVATCPSEERCTHRNRRTPRRRFFYLPLIPRLIRLVRSGRARDLLRDCTKPSDPEWLADICDGSVVADAAREIDDHLKDMVMSTEGAGQGYGFMLSVSFDGTQVHRHRVKDYWPLIVTVLNLPPKHRIRLGEGTFIVSLMSGGSGTAAEEAIFSQLFVEELKVLNQGIFVQRSDTLEPLVARVVHHAYDTKALQKVLGVHGPGSRAGCPLCRKVAGQYRSILRKVVHAGHRCAITFKPFA